MEDFERQGDSSCESDVGSHIAKVGTVYTHLGNIQKVPVNVLAPQNRSHGQPQQGLMGTTKKTITSSEFIYPPLNGSREMRVLELHPGKYEAELSCTLLCRI